MPGFGSKLMLKRLSKGYSIKDAAKESGLKQKQIKSLEAEEILRFGDKEEIAGLLKKYAVAMGLDESELLRDLDFIWSDSSTAKAYMQQKYKKQGGGKLFGENPALGYGAAVAALVLFLSVGGYFYWNGFSGRDDSRNLYSSPPEAGLEAKSSEQMGNGPGDEETPAEDESVLTANNGQESEEPGLADTVSENTAAVEEVPEPPAQGGEESVSLPRSGGFSYMLWIGLLTFCTGLVLFLTPVSSTVCLRRFDNLNR